MRRKEIRWLFEELPGLVERGILQQEAADRLKQHYSADTGDKERSVGLIVCSVLGAALIGLGIILLLAHNWDEFTRPLRTVLAFLPLVAAQLLAAWAIQNRRECLAWREGCGVFLMASVGACIALISQTYNLGGTMDKFLLVWMLISLPVVYLLGTSTAAAFYIIGISFWAYFAQEYVGHALMFWPLLALVAPHVWLAEKENRYGTRAAFLCWILSISLCVSLGMTLERCMPGLWIIVYVGYFGCLYLASDRWFNDAPTIWRRPFHVVGASGVAVLSLILTYEWCWDHIGWYHYHTEWPYREWVSVQDYVLALGFLIGNLVLAIDVLKRRHEERVLFGLAIVPAVIGVSWVFSTQGGVLGQFLFNAYLLLIGVDTLRRGVKAAHLATLNAGLFLLSALIIARFYDSDLSFTLRGVSFIVLGVVFLVTNVLVKRKGVAS